MQEIWKEIEIKGYYVSNFGNIKGRSGKILKLHTNKNGYFNVTVYPNGKHNGCKCLKIHRLVAKAFIPNPNNLPIINHIDGNKLNNNVSNLEWCTYSYNTKHAYDNKLRLSSKGCNNVNSKLSKSDVEWIRQHYIPNSKKYGTRALAKRFKIHHSNISRLINKLKYK